MPKAAHLLTAIALAALCVLPFDVGLATAQNVPELDALLRMQDDRVLAYYRQTCIRDKRYEGLLGRVGARLNANLAQVYRGYRPVHYYTFIGQMGFNAQTWNSIIIFDSLLLDALRDLAAGVAVYGTTDCEYVHKLAQHVARVDLACRRGQLLLNLESTRNPYMLPALWGLRAAQRDRADDLFEEMLASWMAHEGSHAFLEHYRERVDAQRLQALSRQQDQAPEVREYINHYLSYATSRQKELEADEYGLRLAVRSGYGVDGFVYSMEFVQMLEDLTGESSVVDRTHPTTLERIMLARQIAGQGPR